MAGGKRTAATATALAPHNTRPCTAAKCRHHHGTPRTPRLNFHRVVLPGRASVVDPQDACLGAQVGVTTRASVSLRVQPMGQARDAARTVRQAQEPSRQGRASCTSDCCQRREPNRRRGVTLAAGRTCLVGADKEQRLSSVRGSGGGHGASDANGPGGCIHGWCWAASGYHWSESPVASDSLGGRVYLFYIEV